MITLFNGAGIPVFINLRRPIAEEAKQLGATINVPGGAAMFHIVGVTPEAPTVEVALGGNVPLGTYVFDESAKRRVYEHINYQPEGKVNLVYLGCPHATLYEIKEISQLHTVVAAVKKGKDIGVIENLLDELAENISKMDL